jgi:hypothetical protein
MPSVPPDDIPGTYGGLRESDSTLLGELSYPRKVSAAPRIETIYLPFMTLDDVTENPYGSVDTFPGGGTNNHQSTQQWTEASVQQAEASTSLAAAKPINTENNNQSEVSNFFYPARDRTLY